MKNAYKQFYAIGLSRTSSVKKIVGLISPRHVLYGNYAHTCPTLSKTKIDSGMGIYVLNSCNK